MSRQVLGVLVGVTCVAIYIRSFSVSDAEIARNHLGLICTVVSLSVCASPLVALVRYPPLILNISDQSKSNTYHIRRIVLTNAVSIFY